jgi:hypothetical protein
MSLMVNFSFVSSFFVIFLIRQNSVSSNQIFCQDSRKFCNVGPLDVFRKGEKLVTIVNICDGNVCYSPDVILHIFH